MREKRFGKIPTFLQHSYNLSSDNSHPDDQTNDRLYLAQRLTKASALLSYSIFCFYVTMSQHRSVKYDEIQPVFAADRFSTFTRLDFLTRVCRQFWNGTENSQKTKRVKETLCLSIQDSWPNHFALTLTSLRISSEVISLRAGYKIFRSGLLCAVTQLTLVLGEHIVKALAPDVTITFPQTHITECCSNDYFKNVFLKHFTKDGDFTCIKVVLSNN